MQTLILIFMTSLATEDLMFVLLRFTLLGLLLVHYFLTSGKNQLKCHNLERWPHFRGNSDGNQVLSTRVALTHGVGMK